MRLHHLSVTAFGPFVETARIDFDVLSEAGLFLLSGATGAGKSSVLDAVCFALYGAVPGDRQHAGRLRSDQAPVGLAPMVELEATLSGRRFRIVRSPAWDRPKKRGTGTTREQARVALSEHLAEGWQPLTSRLDEAGDLVSGLLGMNLDQFCQVALLPQGHFQAFLRADSAGRHRLLARLFRTGRFERMELWLRDHRLALRRESDTHAKAVSNLVSRLSEAAGTPVPEELAQPDAVSGVSSGAWAELLLGEARDRLAAARAAVADAALAERAGREAAAEAVELARDRDRVVAAAESVERLDALADEHAADRERLDRARRAEALRPLVRLVDERADHRRQAETSCAAVLAQVRGLGLTEESLSGELERVMAELASLTALLPAEERLTDLRAERVACAATLEKLSEEEQLAVAERVALAARVTELQTLQTSAAGAREDVPAAEAEVASLRGALAAHGAVVTLTTERAALTLDHEAAVRRVLELREELLDLRERRIAGMAAELAGGLAVGDDCPVCGSADHPRPASATAQHPDAAAERAAQRAVDDAQAVEHALELRVRELGAELDAARAAAGADEPVQLQSRLAAAEETLSALNACAEGLSELTDALEMTRQRIDAIDAATGVRRVRTAELTTTSEHLEQRVAELEAQVASARGEHPSLAPAVNHLESRGDLIRRAERLLHSRDTARTTYAEAETALGRAVLEAGFDHADEARDAVLPAEHAAALDARLREHDATLAAARQVLDEPDAWELLTTPAPDVVGLQAAHRELAGSVERARAAEEVATTGHARVQRLTADLRSASEAWSPVRRRLALVTRVASFAEGKAGDNRWQMRLSAYVLAYRLSQVVAAANARLAGMSDQRYSLEHVGRRGAGETRGGLSLVVRDDWSGESRDPATLSGGETFVVSLALALGLADVVAHEAGGADLQTLFVDEGFGSLDAETLDDVLDILDTLRENGRAVGVVSHVAEMRHRIPTQLVVSKARSGSTVRIAG